MLCKWPPPSSPVLYQANRHSLSCYTWRRHDNARRAISARHLFAAVDYSNQDFPLHSSHNVPRRRTIQPQRKSPKNHCGNCIETCVSTKRPLQNCRPNYMKTLVESFDIGPKLKKGLRTLCNARHPCCLGNQPPDSGWFVNLPEKQII